MKIKMIDHDATRGPSDYYVDFPVVPRRGDYVDMGDGIRRHVEAVVWLETPETGEFAHEVRIDLRMGVPR